MKLDINKIITLGNNEEYFVVDMVEKDGNDYYTGGKEVCLVVTGTQMLDARFTELMMDHTK